MTNLQFGILSHNARLGIDYRKLTPFQFKQKLLEEVDEVLFPRDRENELEESLDIVQLLVNKIAWNYSKEEIEEGLKKHNEKLNSRGWKLKEVLEIKFKGE